MSTARKLATVTIIAAAVTSLAACGKSKGKDEAGGKDKAGTTEPAGGGGGGDKAKPTGSAWLKVPTLGVQLEAPGDAKANPGAGDSIMVQSDTASGCTIMLSKETPDMMESFDKVAAQIKEARMGNGKLKSMSKEDKGADGGWKLEWQAESSMDPSQTMYGVNYRVMINGAAYSCVRNTDSAAGQACVAKACASLKAI